MSSGSDLLPYFVKPRYRHHWLRFSEPCSIVPGSSSPLIELATPLVLSRPEILLICLDVHGFTPEELRLTKKAQDGYVVIEGAQEEKDLHNVFMAKSFKRSIRVPNYFELDWDNVSCSIESGETLVVAIPKDVTGALKDDIDSVDREWSVDNGTWTRYDSMEDVNECTASSFSLNAGVRLTLDNILISLRMPDFLPEEVTVEILPEGSSKVLVVQGFHQKQNCETGEIDSLGFKRTYVLPANAMMKQVDYNLDENGILKVIIPRKLRFVEKAGKIMHKILRV